MKQFQGGVNMKAYSELTKEELLHLKNELNSAYEEAKEKEENNMRTWHKS